MSYVLCLVIFIHSLIFLADNIGKKRKRTSLVMSKKKRKLLPYNPTVDAQRRLEQMASLATALRASNTEFSNKLTYVHSKALRSANKAVLEKGGMQVWIDSCFFTRIFISFSIS